MKTYTEFITYLFSLQDLTYAQFQSKLLKNDQIQLIGIRVPILQAIAKKIAKNDYDTFLKENKHQYYEETLLHGLVVTSLKNDNVVDYFEAYIPYIDNWASCDIVVSHFKWVKKHKEIMLERIFQYINSPNPWCVRVGLVLLLSYYVEEDYLDTILAISECIQNEDYYVKMANAWLLSICLIKYYDKTYHFLLHTSLDDWTYNKAIQKALESYRITNKEEIRKLKRK